MPLKYPVAPRTILLCDYDLGGFKSPEMIKKRPAVVITGRIPKRDNLCAVVPLSGTAPAPGVKYQCQIEFDEPLPNPFPQRVWWAKADMVATVSFNRLDLFRTERDQNGRRKYLTNLKVTEDQFADIRRAVLHGLGMGHLTEYL